MQCLKKTISNTFFQYGILFKENILMKTFLSGTACTALVMTSTLLQAAPVIGSNGNAYEYITFDTITWSDAATASSESVYLGISGHLASVSSQAENDFILSLLSGVDSSVWLGGSDAETESMWKWLNGDQFWQGGIDGTAGPDTTYTNWKVNDPNNATNNAEGSENYLSMLGMSVSIAGQWNDLPNVQASTTTGAFAIDGYVVEYEVSAVPVPAAVWLFGSGLLGLFSFALRKKV